MGLEFTVEPEFSCGGYNLPNEGDCATAEEMNHLSMQTGVDNCGFHR
jgi:hypothetical protein